MGVKPKLLPKLLVGHSSQVTDDKSLCGEIQYHIRCFIVRSFLTTKWHRPLSWKTRTALSYIFNTITVKDLVTSRKVSKARDQWLEFSNCSEFWLSVAEGPAKFQSDMSILTPDLPPSRLREILRWDTLCYIESVPWWPSLRLPNGCPISSEFIAIQGIVVMVIVDEIYGYPIFQLSCSSLKKIERYRE